MFLRLLLPFAAMSGAIFASTAAAQDPGPHTWCTPQTADLPDCAEVWVCIGDQGQWVMGQTYGNGLFFGTTWDLTKTPQDMQATTQFCDGAWTDGGNGLGTLTFSCGGRVTVDLTLRFPPDDQPNGRPFVGSGQANDGRPARAWSGQPDVTDIFRAMQTNAQNWAGVYAGPYTCDPEEQVS